MLDGPGAGLAAPVDALKGVCIGLKVDVDTLRGTREGVPRLANLLKRHGADATFYFSVGPDHTGRAIRRVFRKGFFGKVARTSVVKHYGVKTLLYGVLLPGPDIALRGGREMRAARDAGFEVGLHVHDHIRWQDNVAAADDRWTRSEMERGIAAFERVFGHAPRSHAAAGWQINGAGLAFESDYGFDYASDTRGGPAFLPRLGGGESRCPQIPTTLPTFDELIGLDGITEANVCDAVFRRSAEDARQPQGRLQVFTLHAELEGMLLLDRFEALLARWQAAGARLMRMADMRARVAERPLPVREVVMGEIPGRAGVLAMQAPAAARV